MVCVLCVLVPFPDWMQVTDLSRRWTQNSSFTASFWYLWKKCWTCTVLVWFVCVYAWEHYGVGLAIFVILHRSANLPRCCYCDDKHFILPSPFWLRLTWPFCRSLWSSTVIDCQKDHECMFWFADLCGVQPSDWLSERSWIYMCVWFADFHGVHLGDWLSERSWMYVCLVCRSLWSSTQWLTVRKPSRH